MLLALIGGLFAFFWSREERSASLLWFCLPFLMAVVGAAVAINPALKPAGWGMRIGTVFIVAAYGFVWQMARVFYHRRPLLWAVLAPTCLWVVLSATIVKQWDILIVSASIRTALTAGFTGLAAYEFWRSREDEDLPSRRVLFWVFAVYSGLNLARIPVMQIVPMPIGLAPTAVWSIIIYNLAAVALALLVSMFMIALSRERTAARNYSLAMRDAMTDVYNRRAYYEHMRTFARTAVGPIPPPYALLIFDIDHFKSINDRFGHQTGDKVIIAAAQAAVTALRRHDKIFRMGGEEFVCLLPDTSAEEAYEVAERLRLVFRRTSAEVDGQAINATISIGATATDGRMPEDQVLAEADAALYRAKQAGRNRTVLAASTRKSEQETGGRNVGCHK